MSIYRLTFNESGLDLPAEIDPETFDVSHSFFHLERYTDEIHLVNTELAEKVANDEATEEEEDAHCVASWQFDRSNDEPDWDDVREANEEALADD